jgi:hypothetical protein
MDAIKVTLPRIREKWIGGKPPSFPTHAPSTALLSIASFAAEMIEPGAW